MQTIKHIALITMKLTNGYGIFQTVTLTVLTVARKYLMVSLKLQLKIPKTDLLTVSGNHIGWGANKHLLLGNGLRQFMDYGTQGCCKSISKLHSGLKKKKPENNQVPRSEVL